MNQQLDGGEIKAFIDDIVCPILESGRQINNSATFPELLSQVGAKETLACSFVRNGLPEVEWDIDQEHWFELNNERQFQVIQKFNWLAVPIWVIESIEG